MPLSSLAAQPSYQDFHAAYQEAAALGSSSVAINKDGTLGGASAASRMVSQLSSKIGFNSGAQRRNMETFAAFRQAVSNELGAGVNRSLDSYLARRHLKIDRGAPLSVDYLRAAFVHLQPIHLAQTSNMAKLGKYLPQNDGFEDIASHPALRSKLQRASPADVNALPLQQIRRDALAAVQHNHRLTPDQHITDAMARDAMAEAIARRL